MRESPKIAVKLIRQTAQIAVKLISAVMQWNGDLALLGTV
jgi:hypothetical protein